MYLFRVALYRKVCCLFLVVVLPFILLFCKRVENQKNLEIIKFEPPGGNYILKDVGYIKIYGNQEVERIYWTTEEDKLPVPGSDHTRMSGNVVTIPVAEFVKPDGSLTISALALLKNGSRASVVRQKYNIDLPPRLIFKPEPGVFYHPQNIEISCNEACKLGIKVKSERKEGSSGGEENPVVSSYENSATIHINDPSEIEVVAEDAVGQTTVAKGKYIIIDKLSLNVYGCDRIDNITFSCGFPSIVSIYSSPVVRIYISEDNISFRLVDNPYNIFLSEPKAYFVYLEVGDVRSEIIPLGFIPKLLNSSLVVLSPSEGRYNAPINVLVYNFPQDVSSEIFIGAKFIGWCPPTCSISLENEGNFYITAKTRTYEISKNYIISLGKEVIKILPISGEYDEPLTVYIEGNGKFKINICNFVPTTNTTSCFLRDFEGPTTTVSLKKGSWTIYVSPSTNSSQFISRNYRVFRRVIFEFPRDATLLIGTSSISLLPDFGFVPDYYLNPITIIKLNNGGGVNILKNVKAIEEGGRNIHICDESGYFEINPSSYSLEYSLPPRCDGLAMTNFGIPIIASGNSVFVPGDSFFSFSISEDVVAISPIMFPLLYDSRIVYPVALIFTKNYICSMDFYRVFCLDKKTNLTDMFFGEIKDTEASIGAIGTSTFLKKKRKDEIVRIFFSYNPSLSGMFRTYETKKYKGEKAFISSSSSSLFLVGRTEDGFWYVDTIRFFAGDEKFEGRTIFPEEVVGVERVGDQVFVCTNSKVYLAESGNIVGAVWSGKSILGCASVGGKLFVVEPSNIYVFDIRGEAGVWSPARTIYLQTLAVPQFGGYTFLGGFKENVLGGKDIYICNEKECKVPISISSEGVVGESYYGKVLGNNIITLDKFPIFIEQPLDAISEGLIIKDMRFLPSGFLPGSGCWVICDKLLFVYETEYEDRTTIFFVKVHPTEVFSLSFENFEFFLNKAVFQAAGTAVAFIPSKFIVDENMLGMGISSYSKIIFLDSAIQDLLAQKGYILARYMGGFYTLNFDNVRDVINVKKFISSSLPYIQEGIVAFSPDGSKIKVMFVDTGEKIWEGELARTGILWASFSYPYVFVGYPGAIEISKVFRGLTIPASREGEITFKIDGSGFTKITLCPECKNCSIYVSQDGGRNFSEFMQEKYYIDPVIKIKVKGGDKLRCFTVGQM